MTLLAVSDQVWLALIQLATLVVGVVSVWMQQRNKTVTEAKAKQISAELAVNTALTRQATDKAEATHQFVQKQLNPDKQ